MALKYSVQDQISMIFKLQNDAKLNFQKIGNCLDEADRLIEQMEHEYGREFVHQKLALKLIHKGIGLGHTGNRDWLEINNELKII